MTERQDLFDATIHALEIELLALRRLSDTATPATIGSLRREARRLFNSFDAVCHEIARKEDALTRDDHSEVYARR